MLHSKKFQKICIIARGQAIVGITNTVLVMKKMKQVNCKGVSAR